MTNSLFIFVKFIFFPIAIFVMWWHWQNEKHAQAKANLRGLQVAHKAEKLARAKEQAILNAAKKPSFIWTLIKFAIFIILFVNFGWILLIAFI